MLGEEFLSLSLDQVCSLISSDKLTVSSEEKVFEAVISWINYEKETRLDHMAKLMEHVRLPLLPRDYLVQVSVYEFTQPEEHRGTHSGCVVRLRCFVSLCGEGGHGFPGLGVKYGCLLVLLMSRMLQQIYNELLQGFRTLEYQHRAQ